MRRLLAMLLACAFGLIPLGAVAASASAQASIPACCRVHGAHRCMVRGLPDELSDPGAKVRAPACPFGHAERRAICPSSAAAEQLAEFLPQLRTALHVVAGPWDAHPLPASSASPRGPPSALSS